MKNTIIYLKELKYKIHLLKADLEDDDNDFVLTKIKKVQLFNTYLWNFSCVYEN